MMSAILAGTIYFICVFAVGVVLGTIRVLFIVPAIGATAAVLIEMPAILIWSWFICGRILREADLRPGMAPRMGMAVTSFVLVIVTELVLFVLTTGRPVRAFFVRYGEAAGAIGLLMQIMYGLLPLFRRQTARLSWRTRRW
jgi:small-conductance mechanosensitive channel